MMSTVPTQEANNLAPAIAEGSRRTFLKMAAFAGITAAGAEFLTKPAIAAGTSAGAADSIQTILTVARTAEQLAVTFYTNGIHHASTIGIHGDSLDYLKAAVIQEQIHQLFFTANGGDSLATEFSFPFGELTFIDQLTFFQTQQQLEGVFDSAFLAAVKEFAQLGQPDLAQITAQVAMIESEHRVLGREIGGLGLADNWAFAPVLIKTVGDAPTILSDAGFLSPVYGNRFEYKQLNFQNEGFKSIYDQIEYKAPFSESGYGSAVRGPGTLKQ